MLELIKRNRIFLNSYLQDIEKRRLFSPALYGSYFFVTRALRSYVFGLFLDVGCGDMPYRQIILEKARSYDGLDIEKRSPDIRFIGDIQNMQMISDQSYDSSVCLEVLEHVTNPFRAVEEIFRILKPGGVLVLSTPHLSRLHEEPHDYFRYTIYGLKYILESTGFEVLKVEPEGGLFSFLGHQFATLFVLPFWGIPVLREVVFYINQWICVKPCSLLDHLLDRRKIFALGYVCVARKPQDL
jgi:SAM-dependent methyltransferase